MSLISQISNGEAGLSVRGKLNSAIQGTLMRVYAHNSTDQSNAITYFTTASVGDSCSCIYWGSDKQNGSDAIWDCVATTGATGSPGDISYQASVDGDSTKGGIVMEGSNGRRWRLRPKAGNIVDVRAANIKCDGVTVGQQSRLAAVIAACVALNYKSVGGGTFKTTETIDARRLHCDWSMMKITAGVAGASDDSGNFYTGGNGGTQSSITTYDLALWGGGTKRLGVVVRGGGNGRNSERLSQRFFVWGDGDFDFKRLGSTILVRWENDDSSEAEYWMDGSYGYVGHDVFDSMEKGYVRGNLFYCTYARLISGATADTLRVETHASICQHWGTEIENTDTSVIDRWNVENRFNPCDGSPSIYHCNGKNHRDEGRMRAGNGELHIFLDRTSNGGLSSYSCDMTFVHGEGTILWMNRAQQVFGHIGTTDWGNTDDGDSAGPCVRLNRATNCGGLRLSLAGSKNTGGAIVVGHDTLATFTADTVNGNSLLSGVSSYANLQRGMNVTGTGIPANTIISNILNGEYTRPVQTLSGAFALGNITQLNWIDHGQFVRGSGIADNTRVVSKLFTTFSGTTNGTTTVTGVSIGSTLFVGAGITGANIPSNTVITAINGTTLTISNAATGSATSTFTTKSVVLDKACTASASGVTATFTSTSVGFLASTTNGSAALTNVTETANLLVGTMLKGVGIPDGARVLSIGGTSTAPTVTMDQNATADGSGVHISPSHIKISNNCTATNTGTTVTPVGTYGLECDYGVHAIGMGGNSMFLTDGREQSAGVAFPTTLTGSVINKMKGGSIVFTQHRGNMTIGAGVQASGGVNPQIVVPKSMSRYTITKSGSAVCDVGYPTLDNTGLTIA
jgi:hypothetical protein